MTEGGGGSEKVKNSVTSFMNGPLTSPVSVKANYNINCHAETIIFHGGTNIFI